MEPLPPSEPSSVEVTSESRESTYPEESSTSSTSEPGKGLTHTSKRLVPPEPSEPLQNAIDAAVGRPMVQKVVTVQDIPPGVKTNIDKKVVLTAMASTNVPDSDQDLSSSTEQLIPIPYQSFYRMGYYGKLTYDWLRESYAKTIYHMNQYFQYHEPKPQYPFYF